MRRTSNGWRLLLSSVVERQSFPLILRTTVMRLIFERDSHVVKTGDIKNFVITEEAGIAKGIRRMIAITGEDARKASERANEIEAAFNHILFLVGAEKEKALKLFETVSPSFIEREVGLTSFELTLGIGRGGYFVDSKAATEE